MRFLVIILIALASSACATSAAPNFFNGRYYMAGDSDCKKVYSHNTTTIKCLNSKGEFTGYRRAMTSQDLQYYFSQRALEQQQMAQVQAQINANNAQMQQNTQRILDNVSSSSMPSVWSPSNSGGVTYTQVGGKLMGSNGVTYSRVGNSIVGTDGTTCQIIGSHIVCR